MNKQSKVSFYRFYRPFVIAAPILFVLLCIVYVWANIYFDMLVARGEMDVTTANFWIGCFRRSPLVIRALDLIIGIFVARKKKEKHLRMIEDVHESIKDENKIFEKI
jgi:hypothetical protein